MILHELVTNALKYGALSTAQGMVRLTWRVATEGGPSVLQLQWGEEKGPPVAAPSRSGFGTRLIEFSSRSMGGAAELQYQPEGLRVRITVPLQ